MDLFKIIGIGFVTLIITIILKDYKKEYAIFAILDRIMVNLGLRIVY